MKTANSQHVKSILQTYLPAQTGKTEVIMFCERIKELRLSRCVNQVEFGKKIGVTKQSVSNWENNNILPSIDMLIKISQTFSVSTDYLLGLDNGKKIDVTDLTDTQVFHLQSIIDDIRNK